RDILQGHDVHPFSLGTLLGFAVGSARVVDPARVIALVAAVDDIAAAQGKEKSMEGIFRVYRMQLISSLRCDPLAAVLDDAGALWNINGGEYAHAVQGGFFDDVPGF